MLEPRVPAGLVGAADSLPPVAAFLAVAIAAYVTLAAATVAVGFALTEGLLRLGFVARWDGNVASWFADHRSGWLTEASLVGSTMAGGVVIPALIGILVLILVLRRRWRIAAFLLASICIEVATYRVATLLVHRPRPNVHRLEDLPVNASYPSGHTAASIAVYGAIALLVASEFPRRWVRVLCVVLTILIVVFVASSRLYRGMHHPLDAGAGVLIGVGSVYAAVLAARAAGAAVERRRHVP